MQLKELIESIKPAIRTEAEELLHSKNFTNLRDLSDGYEALIWDEERILLPEVIFSHNYAIIESACQCKKSSKHEFCVHVTAMFLGIEKMIEADCDNYHEAVEKLKQK
jgi:hypothetical protein